VTVIQLNFAAIQRDITLVFLEQKTQVCLFPSFMKCKYQTKLIKIFLMQGQECGKTFAKNNVDGEATRIVGGKEAVAHSWPSIARIYYNYTYESFGFVDTLQGDLCGGVLISKNEILTATQ